MITSKDFNKIMIKYLGDKKSICISRLVIKKKKTKK